MIGQTLTRNDRELLRLILTSPNPAETVAVLLDIFPAEGGRREYRKHCGQLWP